MSFIEYIKETKNELTHVSWPTRKQTVLLTLVVVLSSFAVAAYLGLFDFIFTLGLEKLIS